MLSTKQYEQIINAWNDTDKDYSCDKTVNEIFEKQVEKTPDNIAVAYEDTSLAYRELNDKANRLASYLKKNYTVNPDTLIALCLNTTEYMLIAILAVLKAGGAYVPINPNYPDDRIKYILEDTKTKLMLTNELHKQRMKEICKLSTINIDGLENSQINGWTTAIALDDIELQKQLILEPKSNPDKLLTKSSNLAYVIYTSGTTGKPKGVMIEHRSFVATINCMKNLYFSDKEHINNYNHTNYAFDMVIPEYGLPLFSGGTIYIGNNDFDVLDCSNYDFIQMTPSLCDLKLECLINTDHTKLFLGAESVRYNLLVKALNKTIDVVHVYGPTETTVWSTSKYYSHEEDTKSLLVVLGKPFDNEKVYVLDNNLNPLPIGAIGELYIGGIGLARGYLNKPELTAERFIPNPFQTMSEKVKHKNTRLYKTGDLVRWLPEGNLEYIGRNDFQVKIRGYRIELSEIESILLNYEGIKQSVVLAKERLSKDGQPIGNKYLVGYYVSESKLNESDILNYLQSQLPEYMVPNVFMHLYNLPLSINGKLDRKSLPEPEFSNNDCYTAPRNMSENLFCSIWAEILSLPEDKAGIHDDFFKLGGDSILAIRLVGKINKIFKSQLKVSEVFELRCISKLIELVTSAKTVCEEDELYIPFNLIKIEEYKNFVTDNNLIEDIYPASYLQVRMILESLQDNRGTYHIVSNHAIHAKYDENKLLSIIQALVNKHELLRARFVLNEIANWTIVVYKSIPIDYQSYTNQNSKELISREKLNNFDYTKPGLFRIIINDFGHHFDLILSFHHAIEDGWSMASLINEFGQAYTNNKPIEGKLSLRYGEFVRNELAAIRNSDNIKFWQEYLNGLKVTKINGKFDKQETENGLYDYLFVLSNEQVKLIHEISQESKISVDSIFLFTYLKTLSYFTHCLDVTIGWVVNNRLEKEDGDKLFGLFLNVIPFRFNFNNGSNGLLAVFNNKLKLQKYKEVPYDYIKSFFKHELYDFVFNFVHLHILNERVSSVESTEGYERTHIPFTLTVVQKGDSVFALNVSAQDNYINEEFLNNFILFYKKCLDCVLKDPCCRQHRTMSSVPQ